MPPQLIAGDVREHDAMEFKAALDRVGIKRIDTAARYTGGESEKKIGRSKLSEHFTIDTKILLASAADGTLSPAAIDRSLTNSLTALGVQIVNVLYCHVPDWSTPLAEQAKAFDGHYREGRFRYLGVSNFPPSMVEEWLAIADKNGYVKPSVYQGQYNLLCRGYEDALFPLLRKHKIAFNGFSPLAGGFLLGNFTADGVQGGTRFSLNTPFTGWYNHDSMHDAIKRFKEISRSSGIPMDELSLRWLVYHSALTDEDGVILGGSKVHHWENNVAQIRKGPLEESMVQRLNALWDVVKVDGMKIVDHAPARKG